MIYTAFYPVRTHGSTTGEFRLLSGACLTSEQIDSLYAGDPVTVGQETFTPACTDNVTVKDDSKSEIHQPDLNGVFTPVVMSTEALRLLGVYQNERSNKAGRRFSISHAVIDAVKTVMFNKNGAK